MAISRRKFVASSLGLIAAAGAIGPDLRAAVSSRKPNIVLINTDDQPSWWVGAYGNKEIHTPNMDRLAAEGMLFRTAVTCPVCSPSRAMLLTGRYNHQIGIDDFISNDEDTGLPNGSITFAQVLANAGYTTGIVGKWHLGKEQQFWPNLRGFDYWAGFTNAHGPTDPTLIIKHGDKKPENVARKGFTINILTDYAIDFIRNNRNRPFALYISYPAPHMGYLPVPEEDMAPYVGKNFTFPDYKRFPQVNITEEQLHRKYIANYAPVTSIDRNMGILFGELKKLGLEEDTVVIFTGDNGYCLGRHGLESKGNARYLGTNIPRPNMFDDSIVVPLIVRWPGVVEPASECNRLVSHLDFFPTMMELAGLNPASIPHLEGISMLPLLRGKEKIWRNELFLIYDMKYHAVAHMRMIRTKRWKLIHHYENEKLNELYDLQKDPGELENVYGGSEVSSVQRILKRRLKAWEKRVGTTKEDLLRRRRHY